LNCQPLRTCNFSSVLAFIRTAYQVNCCNHAIWIKLLAPGAERLRCTYAHLPHSMQPLCSTLWWYPEEVAHCLLGFGGPEDIPSSYPLSSQQGDLSQKHQPLSAQICHQHAINY
jgi:hypothetical protein